MKNVEVTELKLHVQIKFNALKSSIVHTKSEFICVIMKIVKTYTVMRILKFYVWHISRSTISVHGHKPLPWSRCFFRLKVFEQQFKIEEKEINVLQ